MRLRTWMWDDAGSVYPYTRGPQPSKLVPQGDSHICGPEGCRSETAVEALTGHVMFGNHVLCPHKSFEEHNISANMSPTEPLWLLLSTHVIFGTAF